MSDDNQGLIHKIEHFFDDKAAADDMASEGAPSPAEGDVAEHNPPPGWQVPPVPTTTFNESNVLEAAFGSAVSGIYAPLEES